MLLCKKFTKNQLLFTKDIVIKNKRYRSIFQTEIDPFTEFRLMIFLHGHILIHLCQIIDNYVISLILHQLEVKVEKRTLKCYQNTMPNLPYCSILFQKHQLRHSQYPTILRHIYLSKIYP